MLILKRKFFKKFVLIVVLLSITYIICLKFNTIKEKHSLSNKSPFIFIGGFERSGTTLMVNICFIF